MSELGFDGVRVEVHLVEPSACHSAETVERHHLLGVPHPSQSGHRSRIRDGGTIGTRAGEEQITSTSVGFQLIQQLNDLPRQRNGMLSPHLHASGRNFPHSLVEIEFFPAGETQFRRAGENVGQYLQEVVNRRVSFVGVDISQKYADFLRLGNRRKVRPLYKCRVE